MVQRIMVLVISLVKFGMVSKLSKNMKSVNKQTIIFAIVAGVVIYLISNHGKEIQNSSSDDFGV